MHLCDLDARTAVRIAQTARPAINPIGSFPELLGLLDRARANAKADAAGGGGPSAMTAPRRAPAATLARDRPPVRGVVCPRLARGCSRARLRRRAVELPEKPAHLVYVVVVAGAGRSSQQHHHRAGGRAATTTRLEEVGFDGGRARRRRGRRRRRARRARRGGRRTAAAAAAASDGVLVRDGELADLGALALEARAHLDAS